MLARLEDAIFEGLPNGDAQAWPERFMGAIRPGSDLSRVGWQLLHWLLTDEGVNPGIRHPMVADAVARCAMVVEAPADGRPIDREVAESAENVAKSAARWAAVESAMWSAWGAVKSMESARWALRGAAESARWSAWAAAESAEAAVSSAVCARWPAERSATESATWQKIAAKMIELIERTSVSTQHFEERGEVK